MPTHDICCCCNLVFCCCIVVNFAALKISLLEYVVLLVNHGRPERLARLRRIRSVENATDEVASVMEEALDQLLATGQNLDALEDKSEQLLAQATAFQRKSRGIRFRFCCRNLKLTCCIGSLVSLVIALVTLLVLQYTGVIHLWPTGGGPPSPPGPG